ncbi:MAG: RHS repeat protein [Pseudanabaena sp. CRU_2_10]|nr:RHS repeat protein [Pseudanabaena sp. CRU_2_10]
MVLRSLITETNALGKTRTFTYDAAGNRSLFQGLALKL